MSCTISVPTVQSVVFSSSGSMREETVTLTGRVTGDCTSVNVTVSQPATGLTLYTTIDPTATPPGAPIPVVNGTWTLTMTFKSDGPQSSLPAICGEPLQFTIACASGGSCQFQQTVTLKCPESSSSSSSSSSGTGSSAGCPSITLTNLGCNANGGLNIGVTCANLPSTPLVYQFTYTSTAWTAPYSGSANVLTASFTESTPPALPPLNGEAVSAVISIIGMPQCTYSSLVFNNLCGGNSTSTSPPTGCSITVSGITAVDTNTPPNELDVFGTAIGCTSVDVIVNNVYMAVNVPVASDGTWNALCQNAPWPAYACGTTMQVIAQCSGSAGTCEPGALTTVLSCPQVAPPGSSSSSSSSSSPAPGSSSSSSASPGSPSSSSSSSPSSTPNGPNGLGGPCLILLILALLCVAAAVATMIAWACTFFVVVPLLVAWIVLGILGLGLLVLWAWLCGGGISKGGCSTLRTVISWLTVFQWLQGILAAILAITGLGLSCSIGALIGFAYTGMVISALWDIGSLFHCFGN